jgi:hypothetical protein
MDRPAFRIVLEYQHAWSFWIIRIILDDDRVLQSHYRVMYADVVGGKLLVAVQRDTKFSALGKILHQLEGLAHPHSPRPTAGTMIRSSSISLVN